MARRTVYDPCDTIIIASGQTVHLDRRLQPEASSSWQSDKVWSRIMVQPPAGARDGRSFLLQIFAVIDEADRDRLLIEPNGLDLCCLRLYLWNEFADSRARSTGRFVLAREASNADLSKFLTRLHSVSFPPGHRWATGFTFYVEELGRGSQQLAQAVMTPVQSPAALVTGTTQRAAASTMARLPPPPPAARTGGPGNGSLRPDLSIPAASRPGVIGPDSTRGPRHTAPRRLDLTMSSMLPYHQGAHFASVAPPPSLHLQTLPGRLADIAVHPHGGLPGHSRSQGLSTLPTAIALDPTRQANLPRGGPAPGASALVLPPAPPTLSRPPRNTGDIVALLAEPGRGSLAGPRQHQLGRYSFPDDDPYDAYGSLDESGPPSQATDYPAPSTVSGMSFHRLGVEDIHSALDVDEKPPVPRGRRFGPDIPASRAPVTFNSQGVQDQIGAQRPRKRPGEGSAAEEPDKKVKLKREQQARTMDLAKRRKEQTKKEEDEALAVEKMVPVILTSGPPGLGPRHEPEAVAGNTLSGLQGAQTNAPQGDSAPAGGAPSTGPTSHSSLPSSPHSTPPATAGGPVPRTPAPVGTRPSPVARLPVPPSAGGASHPAPQGFLNPPRPVMVMNAPGAGLTHAHFQHSSTGGFIQTQVAITVPGPQMGPARHGWPAPTALHPTPAAGNAPLGHHGRHAIVAAQPHQQSYAPPPPPLVGDASRPQHSRPGSVHAAPDHTSTPRTSTP